MSIVNANMTPMRVCWIFGVPALFTPYRVSRQTVHFGLYQYDMQALLDSPNEVFVLAEQAEDLFYGTVLTTQKIEMRGRMLEITIHRQLPVLEDVFQRTRDILLGLFFGCVFQ